MHGLIEDEFYLSNQAKSNTYLTLQESIYWFFTERYKPAEGTPQVILFYAGQNQDKILTIKRPVFGDELLNKGQNMRLLTKDLIKGGLPNFESMQTNEWMRQFYEILCQNTHRIVLILEQVETYWRRDTSGSLTHNEVDKYFSLYRELLSKKNCPHIIVFTSSIDDITGFNLAYEQIGLVKVTLPSEYEVGALFSTLDFNQFDINVGDELLKQLGTLPLMRSKAIIEDCKMRGSKLNLLTLRRYITGIDSEQVWGECLKSKLQLSKEIFGQSKAIEKLDDFLNEVREEIAYRKTTGKIKKRILGYRLLAGPTGVGKTEYFRQLWENFAKHDIAYRIFNCTEYTQEHTLLRLTGAPPSYVGSPRGELGEFLIDHPNSIILFDEWEKAHIDILRLFLKIFEGELTLGSGEIVDLSNCIILLTSNAGAAFIKPSEDREQELISSSNLDTVLSALRNKGVPPELEGRIKNQIVIFDHISDETGVKIIESRINKMKSDFSIYHFTDLILDPSLFAFLKNQFQLNRKSGARAVVSQIDALRGDVLNEIQNKKQVRIWVDKLERLRFDEVKAPYQEKPMANIWRYALGEILFNPEDGNSIFDKAFGRIVGQEHIKKKIEAKLRTLKEELPSTYPSHIKRDLVDVFVLGGPTGVGKTETFNILEEILGQFHIKKEIFSMTEYQHESDIYKLIGSPPGYTGSNVGLLGEFLLNNPNSIVCFDEFEKCHINIKLMFLKLLEGKLSLSSGDLVDFSNVMFIFTTNAGNRFVRRCESLNDDIYEQNIDEITYALQTQYNVPDELIGRLKGQIIPFNPINEAEAEIIINRRLSLKQDRIHSSVITFLLDQFVHNPRYGARDIVQNTRNKLIVIENLCSSDSDAPVYVDQIGHFKQGKVPENDFYRHINPFSEDEIVRQAYHEAGHTVCAAVCYKDPYLVKEVSIAKPYCDNSVSLIFNKDSKLMSEEMILNQICVFFSGRAAEIKKLGFSSENSAKDLSEATKLARKMIFEMGMTKNLVPIDLNELMNIPEDYQKEVLLILSEMDEKAKFIIDENFELVERIAVLLQSKTQLNQDDFYDLWEKYGPKTSSN
ncbi:MAG: AAA family ATPase [Deltaproteobacteria bacterium]|nr:AAA family ATPase [Deltaproteobacteria bacterium]